MALAPDLEAAADGAAALAGGGKQQLRLWLRLLVGTQLITASIRNKLRLEFETTLPRFDVLAQLDAAKGPISMGELGARLMVTSGNVTALVNGMAADGLLRREPNPADRRGRFIAMTEKGRRLFDRMAPAHQRWVEAAMAELTPAELRMLLHLAGKLKASAGKAAGR